MIESNTARSMSDEGYNIYTRKETPKQLKKIEDAIIKAAKRGDYSIRIDFCLTSEARIELVNAGYRIEENWEDYTISWEKNK